MSNLHCSYPVLAELSLSLSLSSSGDELLGLGGGEVGDDGRDSSLKVEKSGLLRIDEGGDGVVRVREALDLRGNDETMKSDELKSKE